MALAFAALLLVAVVVDVEREEVVVVVELPELVVVGVVVAGLDEFVGIAELLDVFCVFVEAAAVVVLTDSLKGSEAGPPHPTASVARPASTTGTMRIWSRLDFPRHGSPSAGRRRTVSESHLLPQSAHSRPKESVEMTLIAGERKIRRPVARVVDVG
jgi:hypothetical protein